MRKRRQTPFLISGLKQMRAVTSPVRQEIVDGVSAIGPCSIAALAAFLGRPASGLYFHVRQLERAGLLVRTDVVRDKGRPSALLDVPGRPVYLRYEPTNVRTRAPMKRFVRTMLKSAERSFSRAYEPGSAVTGPHRELWAARSKGRLKRTDLEQANKHLSALIALFDNSLAIANHGEDFFELTFVLAPAKPAAK